MKEILFFLLFFSSQTLFSQILKSENGVVSFVSNAPLELIKGKSKQLRGMIDVTKQEFAFSVEVNSFQGFNSPLQQEHFHENYLETKKFPNITFTGKIIEKIDFQQDIKTTVRAKGYLTVHGVKQERIIKSELEIRKGKVFITSQFTILLAEHQISIPKIVNQKIAEEIQVKVNVEFSK
jgi:polyisoprenoid-binding protein YceI